MAFIYALVDPDTDDIRYIGQTTKSLEDRLYTHIKNTARGIKGHIYNWLRSKPIEPLIFAVEENPVDLDEAEIRWIAYFRSVSPNLTNITNGGYGLSGLIHTEEHNRKISQALKGYKHTKATRTNMSKGQIGNKNSVGYVPTEEKRRKISEGNKGKIVSVEARAKLSLAGMNRKHSEESKVKISNALIGHTVSQEVRDKISNTKRNKAKLVQNGSG